MCSFYNIHVSVQKMHLNIHGMNKPYHSMWKQMYPIDNYKFCSILKVCQMPIQCKLILHTELPVEAMLLQD